MAGRRVVIVGVASHWGAELARRLERDPSVDYLAGIDIEPPAADLERTDFIEADIRSPLLSRLLPATEADTVVHCGILWYPEPGRPARVLHDVNVIGTLQLLAACERTETLERLIVRGSAAIYGCEGAAPYFFTEDMARTLPLRTRFQRDVSELEAYVDNFARRHPALVCCMLRYQPEIGPELDTPLVRYLGLPVVPDPARLRPAAPVPPRRRRDRGARGGDPGPGPRPGQRRPGGLDLAEPHPASRPAARSCRSPIRSSGPRSSGWASASGPARCYGDGVRLLRFGRGVDNRRLRDRDRLSSRASTRRARSGTSRRSRRGAGSARRCIRATSPAGLPGCSDERPDGGADGAERLAGRGDRGLPAPDAGRDRGRPRPDERRAAGGRRAAEAAAATRSNASPAGCSGEYHEDEWGFDEEFAEAVYPLFEFLYDVWWRVEADGVLNVPAHGRALLVANHAGSLFPFDASMILLAIMKQHPLPRWAALHGARLGVRAAVRLRVHAPGRRGAGEPAQRRPAARAGRAGDGLPRGRQGDRQAVLRALPAAALRARRLRRGGAADRRADRAGRRRRLGGDLPEARRRPSRWRGRSARPSSRSRRPSRGSGRSGWCRCRRSGGSSSASRSTCRTTARTPPRTAASCSTSPSRCGRRSRPSSTRTWSSGGSAFV